MVSTATWIAVKRCGVRGDESSSRTWGTRDGWSADRAGVFELVLSETDALPAVAFPATYDATAASAIEAMATSLPAIITASFK